MRFPKRPLIRHGLGGTKFPERAGAQLRLIGRKLVEYKRD